MVERERIDNAAERDECERQFQAKVDELNRVMSERDEARERVVRLRAAAEELVRFAGWSSTHGQYLVRLEHMDALRELVELGESE